MRSLQVIILAAGGGTRMKTELPKVLHPVCGRPMIAYALDLAAASGVKQPIVVLGGETAERIKPHLSKEVTVVIQKTPSGTGDAVLAAKRAVGGFSGDLVILYADTMLIRRTTLQRLIESHAKSNATCTLLTAHLADPTGYGRVVRDTTGAIVGVAEETDATAQQRAIREINVGPLCVKAQPLFEVLANVQPSHIKKEWYLTQAVGLLAHREGTKFQTVRVEEANEALGVNSQADLAKAAAIIRQRIIDSHLHNGVTIMDPATTFIDHGVTIGHDTIIHPCTVIASGVTIGRSCSIGPFARLRSGVAVADETRIGNFVELVRTKVGNRVRINHVTYLGDTTVDDEVNIGAGTITANFDGTNKSPTTIEKGAFIGCDTVLIAPVKVGAKAVTGAGSVVPKGHDVPSHGVVVGVPAHLLKSDGVHKGTPDGAGQSLHHSGAGQAAAVKKPSRPKPQGGRKLAVKVSLSAVAGRRHAGASRRTAAKSRPNARNAQRPKPARARRTVSHAPKRRKPARRPTPARSRARR